MYKIDAEVAPKSVKILLDFFRHINMSIKVNNKYKYHIILNNSAECYVSDSALVSNTLGTDHTQKFVFNTRKYINNVARTIIC